VSFQSQDGIIPSGVRFGLLGAAAVFITITLGIGLVVVVMLGGRMGRTVSCEAGAPATLPMAGGAIVAATVYDDEGAGAYGLGLTGHYPYAELGLHSEGDTDRAHADRIGDALGLGHPLAPLTPLEIRAPNGRSVVAEKRDIGMGGPPIDGHQRAIDLWTTTREALGLSPDWSGLVRIAPGPKGELTAETSAISEAPEAVAETSGECSGGSVEVSGETEKIVEIAKREVGYEHTSAGWYCTKFGPCEEWCALFVTWVWKQAGVKIPSEPYSGTIYTWASEHTHAYPPTAHPQPGWAVEFGTGPRPGGESKHVAIVEKVLPNGEIVIINGDFNGKVVRTGPCLPANAKESAPEGCEAPGPIYGYASPT